MPVRPGFNNEYNPTQPDVSRQKPNEANSPQPYAPLFLKQPVTLPKTTPAGYVGYQPCKLPIKKE